MTIAHPDYAQLAARIFKFTFNSPNHSETMTEMFDYVNPRNGQYSPLIADDVYKVIQDNAEF
jgi:ribonucleoside-diphosphate reductase alpha chain